ncbi:unnamed protein product [Darwinula stevensoni]|uniref:Uncharacterized protein n=1 Tax=Darwinula stevensoni TaxID=69355 RepID=A0A7R9A470_9CRUS|nr:unnamed protein product [Darwinula stevensoni]CAG0893040.1 unnamed protein product [Darwinula stevensoni]
MMFRKKKSPALQRPALPSNEELQDDLKACIFSPCETADVSSVPQGDSHERSIGDAAVTFVKSCDAMKKNLEVCKDHCDQLFETASSVQEYLEAAVALTKT